VDVHINAVIVSAAQSPWDAITKAPGVRHVIVTGGIIALGSELLDEVLTNPVHRDNSRSIQRAIAKKNGLSYAANLLDRFPPVNWQFCSEYVTSHTDYAGEHLKLPRLANSLLVAVAA